MPSSAIQKSNGRERGNQKGPILLVVGPGRLRLNVCLGLLEKGVGSEPIKPLPASRLRRGVRSVAWRARFPRVRGKSPATIILFHSWMPRTHFLLRVVLVPKLRRGLGDAVAVFRILRKADAFKFGKGAEKLEVFRFRRKGEVLEFFAVC